MHYQVGEAAHDKLVTCIKGHVLDVVVDVRPESTHFNKPLALELSESDSRVILIGKGYAHGFLTISPDSWALFHDYCPLPILRSWRAMEFNCF